MLSRCEIDIDAVSNGAPPQPPQPTHAHPPPVQQPSTSPSAPTPVPTAPAPPATTIPLPPTDDDVHSVLNSLAAVVPALHIDALSPEQRDGVVSCLRGHMSSVVQKAIAAHVHNEDVAKKEKQLERKKRQRVPRQNKNGGGAAIIDGPKCPRCHVVEAAVPYCAVDGAEHQHYHDSDEQPKATEATTSAHRSPGRDVSSSATATNPTTPAKSAGGKPNTQHETTPSHKDKSDAAHQPQHHHAPLTNFGFVVHSRQTTNNTTGVGAAEPTVSASSSLAPLASATASASASSVVAGSGAVPSATTATAMESALSQFRSRKKLFHVFEDNDDLRTMSPYWRMLLADSMKEEHQQKKLKTIDTNNDDCVVVFEKPNDNDVMIDEKKASAGHGIDEGDDWSPDPAVATKLRQIKSSGDAAPLTNGGCLPFVTGSKQEKAICRARASLARPISSSFPSDLTTFSTQRPSSANFNSELLFCAFAAEDLEEYERRPTFLGTHNRFASRWKALSTQNNKGGGAAYQAWLASAVEAATVEEAYEDSADDWESEPEDAESVSSRGGGDDDDDSSDDGEDLKDFLDEDEAVGLLDDDDEDEEGQLQAHMEADQLNRSKRRRKDDRVAGSGGKLLTDMSLINDIAIPTLDLNNNSPTAPDGLFLALLQETNAVPRRRVMKAFAAFLKEGASEQSAAPPLPNSESAGFVMTLGTAGSAPSIPSTISTSAAERFARHIHNRREALAILIHEFKTNPLARANTLQSGETDLTEAEVNAIKKKDLRDVANALATRTRGRWTLKSSPADGESQ
eukprot:PhM_4_TR18255/c0_g1_i1/m.49925